MMTAGDPRLRLVAALLAVAAISQLRLLPVALVAFALSALLAALHPGDRRLWRRMLHVEGFMLLLFVTLPFTVAGPTIANIGPLEISSTGLERAALIALKLSSSVLILMVLVGNLDPARLGATLHALHVPERLSRLAVMTARHTELIRAEAQRLAESMRARGFQPRSNRHTWRSYGNLVGMILVRALDRADRIEEAMRCRGYSGRYPYAAFPRPALRDWASFALVSGAGFVLLAIEHL